MDPLMVSTQREGFAIPAKTLQRRQSVRAQSI
jgi:hypothetical protein